MNNAYEYMEQYFNGGSAGEYTGKLTEEERQALKENGIKELEKNEITNNNLKDNENIKGVITGEVPIPTGFSYKEGTKDTGAVITDGESEFVWVPVPNISEMAVLQADSTENYQGVLYDFEGTTATRKTIETIGGGSGYREPDVLTSTNYDESTDNLAIINNILGTNYTTIEQLKTALQNDFNIMVESVNKYKGFFVGRYETSVDETKKPFSKIGVIPLTARTTSGNSWYGLYAYQKKIAGANNYTSVESQMIWGCNYDAMLRWALTGAEASKVTTTGNATHELTQIYETGKQTVEGKIDKINNIYDLEGNGFEWTAEAYITSRRGNRGGSYGNNYGANRREYQYSFNTDASHCSRAVLCIK